MFGPDALQKADLVKLPPLHKTIASFHHHDEPGLASAPLSSSNPPPPPRSRLKSHPEVPPAPEGNATLRKPLGGPTCASGVDRCG